MNLFIDYFKIILTFNRKYLYLIFTIIILQFFEFLIVSETFRIVT